MRRCLWIAGLLWCCIPAAAAQARKTPAKPPARPPEFRWLDPQGAATGVQFATHQLQPLASRLQSGPPVEIERTQTQLDAQTVRITSRKFATSVNGARQLEETVVEEIRRLPDGSAEATRTLSRRDANGAFIPYQKEIQTITPSGPDTCKITQTILQPGVNRGMVEKEQIQQIEKQKSDQSIEIDRTRYQPVLNGKWSLLDRRISRNNISPDSVRSDEQVYRYDVNNRVTLVQQVQTREWNDAAGQRHLKSETFSPGVNGDGALQLVSRITMATHALAGGQQQTVETEETPNPAEPSAGLRVARRIVDTARTLDSGATQHQLEVLAPDVNGGMRALHSQKTIETR